MKIQLIYLIIILWVSNLLHSCTSCETKISKYKNDLAIKNSIEKVISSIPHEGVEFETSFLLNLSAENTNPEALKLKSYTVKLFLNTEELKNSAILEEVITKEESITNNNPLKLTQKLKLDFSKLTKSDSKLAIEVHKYIFNAITNKKSLDIISSIKLNFYSDCGEYSKEIVSEEQAKIEVD